MSNLWRNIRGTFGRQHSIAPVETALRPPLDSWSMLQQLRHAKSGHDPPPPPPCLSEVASHGEAVKLLLYVLRRVYRVLIWYTRWALKPRSKSQDYLQPGNWTSGKHINSTPCCTRETTCIIHALLQECIPYALYSPLPYVWHTCRWTPQAYHTRALVHLVFGTVLLI